MEVMSNGNVIELDPEGYVAKGRGSLVFNDPSDTCVVLKVPIERRQKRIRRRISGFLRPSKRRYGQYREWYREYEEYVAALRKFGSLPRCIPAPRGIVQTSLGPACAVEKITDEVSSDLALTIEAYIKDNDAEELRPAIERFFDEVKTCRIIFFDLKPYNLCVVRDARGQPVRVVSIDSIGESTLLRIRKWSTMAYDLWFRRARKEFLERIYPN